MLNFLEKKLNHSAVLGYLRVFAKFSELVMAPVKVLKAFYYCGVNSYEIFTNANEESSYRWRAFIFGVT